MNAKKTVTKLFALAGVEMNGPNPWDIQVKNEKFYKRVLSYGSMGLGESYMDGWWECDQIDEMINKVLSAKIINKIKGFEKFEIILESISFKILNKQSRIGAFQVAEEHYDLGNDLYERMLDPNMVYTCGYWKEVENLQAAQEAKMDLVCRKAGFKPGMKILDIGCGWGSFVKYAAKNYGVKAVGITISKEQINYAREDCKGLDVEIRFEDYRDTNEKFDAIVSIGMFEAVGQKNYRDFMKVVHKNLKDDGIFLLHTIGGTKNKRRPYDPWIEKYIFPNGTLSSQNELTKSIDSLFIIEDWHNFGVYYDKTLMAWHDNFVKNWPDLKDKYDERFFRMWKYYLLCCAGSFRARNIQLWQIALSKNGIKGGYESIR